MFANARIFEEQLLQLTRASLQGKGQFVQHQLLSEGGSAGRLVADLIFVSDEGPFAGRPTILEFKFSRTTTLPHSIILGVMQQFAAIRAANADQSLRFVLVTNGRVRDLPAVPRDVLIVDSVRNRNIWQRRLAEVLMGEPASTPRDTSR